MMLPKESATFSSCRFNCFMAFLIPNSRKYILNRPCFSAWERQNFDTLLAEADLVDAFRELHPEENKPSFYGNFRFLGIGNRIDYFLVSRSLLKDVKDSDILTAFGTGQSVPIILTFQKQLN